MTTTDTPKKSRGRNSTSDKIWAVGLASATCVGLVGMIGVRAVADASEAQPEAGSEMSGQESQSQLDAYAAQLASERAALDSYRASLEATAVQIQEAANQLASVSDGSSANTVAIQGKKNKKNKKAAANLATAPVPIAAAPPAQRPAPQATSKSS